MGREICRSPHLVNGPIVFCLHPTELHTGGQVRNLKDRGENPAEDEMEQDKCCDCRHERQREEGRQDKKQQIRALANQKFDLPALAQIHGVPFVQTTVRETEEVFPEQPFDCVQTIEQGRLELLPSKASVPSAGGRQSENATRFQIIIPSVDIWLAVMMPMFVHPEMPRGTKQR